MKLMARNLTVLLPFVLWMAAIGHSQTSTVIKVNIPFEFSVGEQTFAPGDYSIVQPLQHLLVLRDGRGHTLATTFTTGVQSPTAPAASKLRFRSVNGRSVLTEVWQQNDRDGLQLHSTDAGSRNDVARHRSLEAHKTAEGSQP